MKSIRKWFCKPKRSDPQLLAQFYFANEELNEVSQELDSFDGRQDPDRCTALVNHLRRCQDKVLSCVEQIMVEAIPNGRANRDHRLKFPEDVLMDSLPGQLWFGAECLGAGSTIMNREIESAALRPLARGLTKTLDTMRLILKDQCYENINEYGDKAKDILKRFDETFAEFELSYVSTMVPVKSSRDYDTQQDVIVLFCETLNRALEDKLITQDQVDDYEPGLMFTIPRLAIVSGLVVFPEGPLNMDREAGEISELFRPFQALLLKIKELLQTLSEEEVHLLEKALSSTTGSWEDVEEQLKLMGKGSKTRCHASVQTDPTDFEMDESFNGGLMFGMSPVEEEVNCQGQSSSPNDFVHMLGSSPNDNGKQDVNLGQILATCQCISSTQVINGVHSFGTAVSDNLMKGNNISTLSEQSGEHGTGTLMLAGEPNVACKISPKRTVLKSVKPVYDQARRIGLDNISDLYSMSPMETPEHIFAGDSSPLIIVSPMDSPTACCHQDHGRTGELGMLPVTSHISHQNFDIGKPHSQPRSLEITQECRNLECRDHMSDALSSDCSNQEGIRSHCESVNTTKNMSPSTDLVSPSEQIQGSELHKLSSPCEDCKEKQAIQDVCRQVVDEIVQYTVQYLAFTNAHHEGKCCKGSESQACPPAYGTTLPEKDEGNRCMPKQGDAPVHTHNFASSTPEGDSEDQRKHGISKTNFDVPVEGASSSIQGSTKCNCAMIREQENTSTFQAANVSHDISDCPSANSVDLSNDNLNENLKCAKHSVSETLSTCNPDIVYSKSVTHKCGGAVVGAGFPLKSDEMGATWESLKFGKGKASTELSRAIPLGECLQHICGNSPDNANPEELDSRRHLSVQVQSPSSGRVYPASAINRVTGSRGLRPEAALAIAAEGDIARDRSARDRRESNVSIAVCSSCGDELVDDDELYLWESDDSDSDSTSAMSENDEHEIAIAIQAAELSAKQEARSHFTSSWDLVHRLFVCIAGVADQLQTNYASDLRNILKVVFEITANPHKPLEEHELYTENRSGIDAAVQDRSGLEDTGQDMSEIEDVAQDMPGLEDMVQDMSRIEDAAQDRSEIENAAKDMSVKEDTVQVRSRIEETAQDKSGKEDTAQNISEKEDTVQARSGIEDTSLDQSGKEDTAQVMFEKADTTQDMSGKEDIVQDMSGKEDTTAQDMSGIVDTVQDTASKEMTTQDMPVKKHIAQDVSGKEDTTQDRSEKEDSAQDMSGKEDTTRDRSGKEDTAQRLSLDISDETSDENKLSFAGNLTLQLSTDTVSQSSVENNVMFTSVGKSCDQTGQSEYPDFHDQPQVEDTKDVSQDNSSDGNMCIEGAHLNLIDQCTGSQLYQDEKDNHDDVFVDNTEQFQQHSENSNEDIAYEKSEQEQDSNQLTTQEQHTPNQAPPEHNEVTISTEEQSLGDKLLKENVSGESGNDATDVRRSVQHGELEVDSVVFVTQDSTEECETNKEGLTKQDSKDENMAVKPKKKRHKSGDNYRRAVGHFEEPPLWVPDEECSQCTTCKAVFTMIRRKHHCRNCGKIFCSRCSGNSVPLPKFGQEKPVRVCNWCYMFQVTPFQH